METGVSCVVWEPPHGRRRVVRRTAVLKAASCTGTALEDLLDGLLKAERVPGRARIRWIILKECFPPAEGASGTVGYPEWMRDCWNDLPIGYLPAEVVSGTGAVIPELLEWPAFSETGSGFFMEITGRALFLGHGGGRSFIRVSRRDLRAGGMESALNLEWLLQSRVLFNNRTGSELRHVLMPDSPPMRGNGPDELPFDLSTGMRPPAWPVDDDHPLGASLLFFHACAANDRNCRGPGLEIPLLRGRVRRRVWTQRLQIAVCLVLAGWVFLLLGACRNSGGGGLPAPMGGTDASGQRERLVRLKAALAGQRELQTARTHPLRVIGEVAKTMPGRVRVQRIHYKPAGVSTGRKEPLVVEGTCPADGAPAVLEKWIHDLEGCDRVGEVENLRLDRDGSEISFILKAWTGEDREP